MLQRPRFTPRDAACCLALLLGGLGTPAFALELDLTSGGSGLINGALFTTSDNQSTGTGVIDSFVRIQQNGSEYGYNASVRPVMPDVNTSTQYTRDIQLSAIPIVNNPGPGAVGNFYEFLLDVNQANSAANLTLHTVQIYTRATALGTAATLNDLTGSGAALKYNMDAGSDSRVQLNYALNNGSGSGDMFLYVPVSAFAGVSLDSYLYLYSGFGTEPNGTGTYYVSNAGFEEWAVRTQTTTRVPDNSSTICLLGGALLALAGLRRNFKLV